MPGTSSLGTTSSMCSSLAKSMSKFDIKSRLARLPSWATRITGFRREKPPAPPTYVIYVWSFIGAFCSLAILQGIFGHAAYFTARHVPPIIASFGASAILCYGSIEVPFAQPRALIGGHFLSAIIGVCVANIFHINFSDDSNDLQWVAGSLSTAIALVVMHGSKTTHPPAGATALLPCVDASVWALGWYYLPVILLSSIIVLVTALLFNNIQRQYPKFWISPSPPPGPIPPPQAPAPAPASTVAIHPAPTARAKTQNVERSALPRTDSVPASLVDQEKEIPSFPRQDSEDSEDASSVSDISSASEKLGNQIILWIPGRVRWTRAEDKTLMRLVRQGKSIDEIAKEFPGRSTAAVFQRSYMVPDLNERNETPVRNDRAYRT